MENASEKIQLFTPENIARKIGGDAVDVLVVLKACFYKGSDAALEWMTSGDHSKPWSLSDGAARGDALLDIRTLQLCADLHSVTVGPHDNGTMSKDTHLRVIKDSLRNTRSFDDRQFHREEIARWLVAFGMHSKYKFGQAVEVPKVEQAVAGTASAAVKNMDGAPAGNWRHQIQAEAYQLWIRLRALGCNPSVNSICDDMAKWCIDKNIKGGMGQHPRAGTIRNAVLAAGHWIPPSHSIEQAKEHVAQLAQTKVEQAAK